MFFGDNNSRYTHLSPFSKNIIHDKGVYFPTVYHYYAYHKFNKTDPGHAKLLLNSNIKKLVQFSNSRRNRIMPSWDATKYDIMRKGYTLKFEQYREAKECLLSTTSDLKYNGNPTFKYWNCYGQNNLGKLLMELRDEFRQRAAVTKFAVHKPEPEPVAEPEPEPESESESEPDQLSVAIPVLPQRLSLNNIEIEEITPTDIQLLKISLDIVDIDDTLCIPLIEKKKVTGEEVSDTTLITIARKLTGKDVEFIDSENWYSHILQHLSGFMRGVPVSDDIDDEIKNYVQGIIDRNTDDCAPILS